MAYSVSQWTGAVLLGALVGAIGQLVRSISGIARRNRERATAEVEAFKVSTLVVGLVIGGVAGAAAALAMMGSLYPVDPTKGVEISTILGIAAAGYTGADFIEGVAGKFMPGASEPAGASPPTSAAATERLTSAAGTVATAGAALTAAATGLAAGVAASSTPWSDTRTALASDEPALG